MRDVKIALCQSKIIPAQPMANAYNAVREIRLAAERGVEVVIFPEMFIPGYLIGDRFECEDFLRQIERANQIVAEATSFHGVVAIFGSVHIDWAKKGEDGRVRKYNAALVAQEGKLLKASVMGPTIKTLQPNYRYFNDDRHFFSLRKLAEEMALHSGESVAEVLALLLQPVVLNLPRGQVIIGLHECEDMWDDDYAIKPTAYLYNSSRYSKVDFFVNLSRSPWGWQKDKKRHSVVRALLQDRPAPYVYVNGVGVDQIGKSIITYDGRSAVYNAKGEIVFEGKPREAATYDFVVGDNMRPVELRQTEDVEELYGALIQFMDTCLPEKVVIGLSGGIDSALNFALAVEARGARNVTAINMPYSYNSPTLQGYAALMAGTVGAPYIVEPIAAMAEPFLRIAGVRREEVTYENVLARARGNILCTYSQVLGAVILCNGTKNEYAFNYGTMYGDIIGAFAPIADLVKREVRQVADFVNRRAGKEIIPNEVIRQKPTAELKTGQFDPFDYGTLEERGYHDELVRAWTEFRKTPEWVLEQFAAGTLEQNMQLSPGRLKGWFGGSTQQEHNQIFISDLERWWKQMDAPYKRNQSPYILVTSRKAFGHDLVESMFPMEMTDRYLDLKSQLLRA